MCFQTLVVHIKYTFYPKTYESRPLRWDRGAMATECKCCNCHGYNFGHTRASALPRQCTLRIEMQFSQNTIDLNSFRQFWSRAGRVREKCRWNTTIYSHAFRKRNYTFQVLVFTLAHNSKDSSAGRHCLFGYCVGVRCVCVCHVYAPCTFRHYCDDITTTTRKLHRPA